MIAAEKQESSSSLKLLLGGRRTRARYCSESREREKNHNGRQ
jgi:hypothetical protein